MPKFAFKFISGKYLGGEFPIPDEGELIIGRAADLDMVLVEDMVSRKHARLVVSAGTLILADLGSTNGTFINGEKIRRAELKTNDRVLIGTSILKVVDASQLVGGNNDRDREFLKAMMKDLAHRAPQSAGMSGALDEVPLPDLLQLFSSNKKTGTLSVVEGQRRGTIYLKAGALQYVLIADQPTMPPMKALCRMLGWTTGQFLFDAAADLADVPVGFQAGTETLLMEVMRQNDEMRRLRPHMPADDTGLRLATPLPAKLSVLDAAELDVLQLGLGGSTLHEIVNGAPGTDYETLAILQKLLKSGYLIPVS